MISLKENIDKAKNLINAIDSLTNPDVYLNTRTRYANEKQLRKTMKNFRRLSVVIDKQVKEGSRNKFKESTSQTRSRKLNTIFK
jgi:ABC-type uncharacterized transport system involved in gliding motility auxiliary subunit